jgi:inosine/xanthosine triphosphatase
MIVAVGSTNPTKIEPVREVFENYFKKVKVVSVDVSSGVNEQPIHHDEMYEGAYNRAKRAIKKVKGASYGVGIEGGLHKYSFGWLEQTTIVIINKKGEVGIGSSGGIVLPRQLVKEIKKGKNLEEVMDNLFGTEKIGEGIGMFGLFTKGLVTRSSGVKHGVAFALSRFLHKKLFE